MRGESFDPGGCSACPTSPAAAATIAAPAPLPAPPIGAVGLAVPAAPGPMAELSMPEKDELPPAAGAVVVGWIEGAGAGGARADWIASMRATTVSMLTCVYSSGRAPALSAGARPNDPSPACAPLVEERQHALGGRVRLREHAR